MHQRAYNTQLLPWHIILFTVLFSLIVAYVWQINNQAQHSFSIRELEQNRTQLAEGIRDLNWQLSQARSLAEVATRAEDLELEAPKEVTYLHIGFSTVAAYDPSSP
ncbi:hypothetical protein BK004_04945 [bacterium CG10_46_32]|nr:MAG: hypothetical protein BK004_04945 [bacterium CG10_46_32]PIR55661.1 MAG: hypothetical protein COU73_04995 [Parcubacteria group bacterium CG10_big_fil_rev_8_21_14_0_10_46_32]